MELQKASETRAMVKREEGTHKLAVGLGAAGSILMLLPAAHWIALAAGIGAILLSWEAATSRDRRTVLATIALGLGALPMVFEVFGVLGLLLKIIIALTLVGGIVVGGRAWARSRKKADV